MTVLPMYSEVVGCVVQAVSRAARAGATSARYDYNHLPITSRDLQVLLAMFGAYGSGCRITYCPDNTIVIDWADK